MFRTRFIVAALSLSLLSLTAVRAAAENNPPIKVLPRKNYFTADDGRAQLIVTGNRIPTATLAGKKIKLEWADSSRNEGPAARLYSLPLDRLKTGDNTLEVRAGDSTWSVRLTLLPAKANGVQIDYLTGVMHTGGLPLIPCGFYSYSPFQYTLAEEEAVRGLNLLSPYQNIGGQPREERLVYLDRAAALGMRVNYNLLSIAGGGGGARAATANKQEKLDLLRQEIRALKDHPAILSWYVADEPEGQGISVETLDEIYRIVREEDPYHPVSIVIMSPVPARAYAATCDVMMVDPYPVPNSPAVDAVTAVRGLQRELRYEKAIWYVPQTFGGAEFWSREPTPAEIRMMTWGAALEGARGFQAFTRHGLNGFPKNPYMWETYAKTCRELQELTPFFERGAVAIPHMMANEGVLAREYRLGDQRLLVLLNSSSTGQFCQVTLNETFSGTICNLVDNSRLDVFNGEISGMLNPFEVAVFKLFDNRRDELNFSGNNRPANPSNRVIDPSFEWEYSVSGNVPAAVYGRVGQDRGATYAIDSRVAYHGDHSLRMISPEAGAGTAVQFYPLPLQLGKSYRMTVWAKADPESLKQLGEGEKMTFRMALNGVAEQECELTDQWQCYTLMGTYQTAVRDGRGLMPSVAFTGRGRAWFDLVEVVPDMDFIITPDSENPRTFRVAMEKYIDGGTIYYTLDGSEPTEKSDIYSGKPLMVSDVRTVKARVVGPDGKRYGVTEQLVAAHKAIGARVTYLQPYKKYTGGGDTALVDGVVAALRYTDKAWQGFIGNDLEAVIDLGESTPIRRISSFYFHSQSDWILPPRSVEYLISDDGQAFESLGVIDLGEVKPEPPHKVPAVWEGAGRTARYIKVIARRNDKMPEGFNGAGDPAWLFADEVVVE